MREKYCRQSGYSLIELLTILSITAILLTLAISSMHHLLASHRASSQIDALTHALNYARNEAVSRNEKITFCQSSDHKTCGGAWKDGQIVLDNKNQLLRAFSALPKGDSLTWNSSAGIDDKVIWAASGFTNGQQGSFYYCTPRQNESRKIVLLDTGRLYTAAMTTEEFASYCK